MPLPVNPEAVKPVAEILVEIPQAEFAALSNESEQKQYLGNYLYQFVQRKI